MQIVRMSPKKNTARAAARVVATAHTVRGLQEARRLGRGQVAFLELRLDALAGDPGSLERSVSSIAAPILITARHAAEGGSARLSASIRRGLLAQFLPRADAVDVELRSIRSMSALLEETSRRGVTKIISFHDFRRTPNLPKLRETVRRATRAGADIVKVATRLRSAGDLAILLMLQASATVPLATMGMGPLGKVSRLALAAAGSRLNYGYLDKPQVPGQWPALELVRRIEEIVP